MSDPLPCPPRTRPAVTATIPTLPLPDADWRLAATAGEAGPARHDALLAEAPCMAAVELVQPPQPAAPPATLRLAAWNLERCKHVETSAAVLAAAGADICLLTEMDLGMARAGNRHTTADLARALGMGHAFGVEFIELGLGDARETAEHRGEANAAGLHGNAVLSRFLIDRAALLPLDPGGLWFSGDDTADQRRIGGRMAIAVRHLLPRPLWVVAVHYESSLGPEDRDRETAALLAHLDALCGAEPVVVAGDFNCRGIADRGITGAAVLEQPETAEPMFARLARAGFDWRGGNTSADTTRNHPWTDPDRKLKKIDWFFARGVTLGAPAVVPATGPDGQNLSDHDLICATLALEETA